MARGWGLKSSPDWLPWDSGQIEGGRATQQPVKGRKGLWPPGDSNTPSSTLWALSVGCCHPVWGLYMRRLPGHGPRTVVRFSRAQERAVMDRKGLEWARAREEGGDLL